MPDTWPVNACKNISPEKTALHPCLGKDMDRVGGLFLFCFRILSFFMSNFESKIISGVFSKDS